MSSFTITGTCCSHYCHGYFHSQCALWFTPYHIQLQFQEPASVPLKESAETFRLEEGMARGDFLFCMMLE